MKPLYQVGQQVRHRDGRKHIVGEIKKVVLVNSYGTYFRYYVETNKGLIKFYELELVEV